MSTLAVRQVNKKYIIGLAIACMYVFFAYVAQGDFLSSRYNQVSLYLLLGWTLLVILDSRVVRLNAYIIWYLCFIVLCVISCFYGKYDKYYQNALYTLFVILGLAFAFTTVISREDGLTTLFWAYSLSADILFLMLLLTDNLYIDERLGTTLSGNANIFATMYMMAAICSVWLILVSKGIQKLLWLASFGVQMYSLALSGGRKYLIIPFILLYIILLLKKDKQGRKHIIKYTVLIFLLLSVLMWLLFSIPAIYYSVGHRFVSFLNFFTGSGYVDRSTISRNEMIAVGLETWKQNPLIGIGINNFMGVYGKLTGHYVYAHNNYVEMLADLGIVGFLFYYSYYVWILCRLLRMKDDGSGFRNFFIAFMISQFIFEIGAITYNLHLSQIFLAFPSIYLQLRMKGRKTNA